MDTQDKIILDEALKNNVSNLRELILWLRNSGYVLLEFDWMDMDRNDEPNVTLKVVVYKNRVRHTFYL